MLCWYGCLAIIPEVAEGATTTDGCGAAPRLIGLTTTGNIVLVCGTLEEAVTVGVACW